MSRGNSGGFPGMSCGRGSLEGDARSLDIIHTGVSGYGELGGGFNQSTLNYHSALSMARSGNYNSLDAYGGSYFGMLVDSLSCSSTTITTTVNKSRALLGQPIPLVMSGVHNCAFVRWVYRPLSLLLCF